VAGPDIAPQISGNLLPGTEKIVLGELAHYWCRLPYNLLEI
jgi:hypothetical protein